MKSIKFGFAAVALAAAFSVSAADDAATVDQGVGAIGWTPVQVGLCAPVSYPWGFDWDLKGLGLDLFYSENVLVKGLAVSGLAARARDEEAGVMASLLCNWTDADARGINLTIGANLGFADVYGINAASFGMREAMTGLDVNLLASYQATFKGWQTSCLCNFTEKECTGASCSLVLNMCEVETGFQGAIINSAEELHGVQVGIINIAHECPWGCQLGLINIILDNRVKILPIFNGYFGGSEE